MRSSDIPGKATMPVPVMCLVLSLVLAMIWGITGISRGDDINQTGQEGYSDPIGNGFINGDGEVRMNALISLVQMMGLHISYGEDGGTIFSMVDQSLTRIITDLSSGNTGGFSDIPLIQETLHYLGISPDDILVNPDTISGEMTAIDRYNERYSGGWNDSEG